MLFDDKTQENIMSDLKSASGTSTDTREGTLIDHSFRGASAEFEKVYIELGLIDQNGYAETADREHLVLRAKERGIIPLAATNAVWEARFNTAIEKYARFSAGEFTYICTGQLEAGTYRLMCEQAGARGNVKQEGLLPVEYIEGLENGELVTLLIPARDEEETEAFRARYLSIEASSLAFGGNRAQYRELMHRIEGVGACRLYRVTQDVRRIKIYFLDSTYKTPSDTLVANVQEITDPVGRQGEGEGEAPIFHVVDVYPCASEVVNIEAEVTVDTGYTWEDLLPLVYEKIDAYFLGLAKKWEDETCIVRILKINQAIAGVEGVVDVQGTKLNGKAENFMPDQNAVPVRGVITCIY
ncbi:MAG: phage tail protein [Lachnospiraceae bacterium]|nr:phage tail protein [Lachnospiraceae bacterium]